MFNNHNNFNNNVTDFTFQIKGNFILRVTKHSELKSYSKKSSRLHTIFRYRITSSKQNDRKQLLLRNLPRSVDYMSS